MNTIRLVTALGLIAFFFNSACTKKEAASATTPAPVSAPNAKSAEDVVKQFIEYSSVAKEDADRKRLLDLCTGEMRAAFEKMTAEAFRLTYLNNNVKVKSVKILDSRTEKETARVRYQITIDNNQGTDPTQEINEREVDLVLSNGTWYIETIRPKGSDKIAFTRGMIF